MDEDELATAAAAFVAGEGHARDSEEGPRWAIMRVRGRRGGSPLQGGWGARAVALCARRGCACGCRHSALAGCSRPRAPVTRPAMTPARAAGRDRGYGAPPRRGRLLTLRLPQSDLVCLRPPCGLAGARLWFPGWTPGKISTARGGGRSAAQQPPSACVLKERSGTQHVCCFQVRSARRTPASFCRVTALNHMAPPEPPLPLAACPLSRNRFAPPTDHQPAARRPGTALGAPFSSGARAVAHPTPRSKQS
jgi:hypothetical protein